MGGEPVGLRPDDPATSVEPFDPSKRAMLTRSADVEEFLSVWRWGGWNAFTVGCVGELPRTTVWINDLLVAEIDLGSLRTDNYDPDPMLGPSDRLQPRAAAGATSGSGRHVAQVARN